MKHCIVALLHPRNAFGGQVSVLPSSFGHLWLFLFCFHENLYLLLGTMPQDYELYYGFTRFAIELNELDRDMAKYLPPTDTRFRPDQR